MIGVLILGLAAFFLAAQYGQPFIYGYRLSAEGVEFVVFGAIRVWLVRFSDIALIRDFPVWGLLFGPNARVALYLRNRIFGRNVLLRRKSGLIRQIVITPGEPAEFVRSVSQCITVSAVPGEQS
jgi:hypothetical protein